MQTLPELTGLWHSLRFYLEAAFTLWGEPRKLAAQLWLSRLEHKRISAYLSALEHLFRRLLLLDAAKYPLQPKPPPRHRKVEAGEGVRAKGAGFDLERPESWRCSVPLLPRPASAHRPSRAAKARARRIKISSAASAMRLEALIRAFNAPEAYAKRLARILADRTGSARADALAVFTRQIKRTDLNAGLHPTIEEATTLAEHISPHFLRADTS